MIYHTIGAVLEKENKMKTIRTKYNPVENGQIYYMVYCDDAIKGDNTDRAFGLNEYDKLTGWVKECKENKWEYSVYIEVFKHENEDILHIAELDI